MPRRPLPQFYGDGTRVLRERPWMNSVAYRAALLDRCLKIKREIADLLRDESSADDDGEMSRLDREIGRIIAQLGS